AVRSGHDPLGRRELGHAVEVPPFYALQIPGSVFVTFGGLAVDGDLQVLDEEGKPISGLHAIGEILGATATSGAAFCSGMLITPALGFGWILGRRLAESRAGAVPAAC